MQVILNLDKLNQIERQFPGRVQTIIQKLAQDMQAEVVNNFSPQSPSAPGSPPGVDTGNLKNSIVATPINAYTWVTQVGAEYGVHLEYGTSKMAARPYMLPAFMRVIANAPGELIGAVQP